MIHFDLLADIALTRIKNPAAKIVLLALARYSNSEGVCFPSQPLLAEDTCLSERTVRSCIQWLEDNSYILVHRQPNKPNIYTITSMMEDDMTDDESGPAKFAAEGDSNITKLDFSKKNTGKSITTSPAKSAGPNDDPFFMAFWQAYPRRLGKGHARIAFRKAAMNNDPNTIVQAAIAYGRFVLDQQIEQQFIPHPATWLNGERWEDDLEAEKVDRKPKPKNGWEGVFDDL
jgi:Helix-turn-helix domain